MIGEIPCILGAAADAAGSVSLVWAVPFALLLLCIAAMPVANHHWWEKHYPWVAIALGSVAAVYYLLITRSPGRWLHGMEEYVSFIILLASLYIVSGGIVISVGRTATPAMNCVLLLIGAVIANVLGTTGASMLLIRPYLRMNRGHVKPYHVVFFIFIVSNIGGLLTPIGDPPLFLGYLNGVPFWWVLEKCWWPWVTVMGVVLLLFYLIDRYDHGKGRPHSPEDAGAIVHIVGIHNVLFIVLILFAVFQPGFFQIVQQLRSGGLRADLLGRLLLCREFLMVVAAVGSLSFTGKAVYQQNHFTYGPIREVAILFLGIFSAMVPALHWLEANAKNLPLKTPGQVYFLSGGLSAMLDNAPTYLTFLETQLARSQVAAGLPRQQRVRALLENEREELFIVAISLASVLFGAMTYIGNGPNLMVKSIAESAGARTPSFMAYIFQYSLPMLLPTYALVWLMYLYPWK